jgi:hypothetical protein
MRRKFLKILLVLLLLFIIFGGVYTIWAWYQMHIGQSLQVGEAQAGSTLGGLIIPQTAVLYGGLAGFFLLSAIVSIWLTYRFLMFPAETSQDDESDT